MTPRTLTKLCAGVGAIGLLCVALTSYAQQPGKPKKGKPAAGAKDDQEVVPRVSVAVARERATMMHDIYESTLHVMHRYYFRNERATVPARALEDVFEEMENHSKVESRWISVNTKPMSIDHEPATDFEKLAAKEIADGKANIERVEDGNYYRATAIPLSAGCVGCHNGLLAPPPKSPRFAGLVIRIPVTAE